MSHTPGPWVAKWCENTDWDDGQVHCAGIEGADGFEIVTTDAGVYGPNEADAKATGKEP